MGTVGPVRTDLLDLPGNLLLWIPESSTMTDPVHALLGDQYRYDPSTGDYYSTIHQEIAETIHRLWPNLSLAWIPPGKRGPEDLYPFAVVETDKQGRQHIVCNCREDELPLLMERLWEMNTDSHDLLAEIDKHNNKLIEDEAKVQAEKMADVHDQAYHILKGKFYYRHNGKKFS